MTLSTVEEVEAYGRQGEALLPRGPLWKLAPGGNFRRLLEGLGRVFADADARARDMVAESDPRLSSESLARWEEELGLPGACGTIPPTTALRRAAIKTKLVDLGGQTPAFFVGLAAELGYSITIEEHRPFVIGSHVGEPLSNGAWRFTWTVHGEEAAASFFSAGSSAAGEPLVQVGNELLECTFAERRPAHTIVRFVYDLPSVGYAPWNPIAPGPIVIEIEQPDTIVSR